MGLEDSQARDTAIPREQLHVLWVFVVSVTVENMPSSTYSGKDTLLLRGTSAMPPSY